MKLKVGIISALAVVVAIPLVMQQDKNKLQAENAALRQQTAQISDLLVENARLSNLLAQASAKMSAPGTNDQFREVLKLRGEVGKLRTAISAPKEKGPSTLSSLQANPEMMKMVRSQQKLGMAAIYKDLAKKLDLPKEQTDKLSDILADNVMENINHITDVLQNEATPTEMDEVFSAQELTLEQQVRELLGEESFAQYQDYTQKLFGHLSAEQFKEMMSGDKAQKDEKAKQLDQLFQEETQRALAQAGLSANFQTLPMLNFRNIASEAEAAKNLQLVAGIYDRVGSQAGSFLSPEEITKLNEFKDKALNNNRTILTMNRQMMAPVTK